jgi:hypothetical protein
MKKSYLVPGNQLFHLVKPCAVEEKKATRTWAVADLETAHCQHSVSVCQGEKGGIKSSFSGTAFAEKNNAGIKAQTPDSPLPL